MTSVKDVLWSMLWAFGFFWTFPNTLVGILMAALGGRWALAPYGEVACAHRVSRFWPYPRAVICENGSLLYELWRRLHIVGASCGLVVVIRDPDSYTDRTLKHESRHSAQSMIFGPLFGFVYVLAGLWAVIVRGQNFYYGNAFEVDARKAEDR